MNKNNILLDSAQCLDDCLIRIYPEEFTKKDIDEAAQRFSDGRGTIARIAETADALRKLHAEKEGTNQSMLNALADDWWEYAEGQIIFHINKDMVAQFIRNWRPE